MSDVSNEQNTHKSVKSLSVLLKLWDFMRPYKKTVFFASFALVFTAGVTLVIGRGVRLLVDEGFAANSPEASW